MAEQVVTTGFGDGDGNVSGNGTRYNAWGAPSAAPAASEAGAKAKAKGKPTAADKVSYLDHLSALRNPRNIAVSLFLFFFIIIIVLYICFCFHVFLIRLEPTSSLCSLT